MDRKDFLSKLTGIGLSAGMIGCSKPADQNKSTAGEEKMSTPVAPVNAGGPKAGLCTIAFSDRPLDEVIELAARAGCDGVEPWGKPDHLPLTRTDDEVKAIRDKIGSLGMEVSHYGSYVRLGDGQDAEAKNAEMDRAIAITRLLGTDIARIWAGTKDSELLGEEDWKLMVDDGKRFCARAEEAGVKLAMEMHGKSVTNRADAAVELVHRVGSPALKLNYQALFDKDHEDYYERATKAGPYVVMCHAQNYKPGGEEIMTLIQDGDLDYNKVWDILKGFGFKGYFEVEFVVGKTFEEKVASLQKDVDFLKSIGG